MTPGGVAPLDRTFGQMRECGVAPLEASDGRLRLTVHGSGSIDLTAPSTPASTISGSRTVRDHGCHLAWRNIAGPPPASSPLGRISVCGE